MSRLLPLLEEVQACRLCEAHLPLGPRPVVRAGEGARLLIVGQAPGTRVQGLTFRDASGTFGAALRVVDSDGVVIIGNRFEGNVALADGGAVSIETSDGVLLTTNQFDDNHAGGSGGAVPADIRRKPAQSGPVLRGAGR